MTDFPTLPCQTWFDPASLLVISKDAAGNTVKTPWADGDAFAPGTVLNFEQWAVFDAPGNYSAVQAIDGPGAGNHWNTRHSVKVMPEGADLGTDWQPDFFVHVNQPFKFAGGYQNVPQPPPGNAGLRVEYYMSAMIRTDGDVGIDSAQTEVEVAVEVPPRTDLLVVSKITGSNYQWQWKDPAGAVIALNNGYPTRLMAKQAGRAVAGSDCPVAIGA